jgi:hypothetical protein
MKNLQIFLLLLSSFSVMAQYHEHKAIYAFSNIQPRKLNKHQHLVSQTSNTNPTIALQKTELNDGSVTPTGSSDWQGSTSVTSYTGHHRVQSYQTFDVRGNVLDSRTSISLKRRK